MHAPCFSLFRYCYISCFYFSDPNLEAHPVPDLAPVPKSEAGLAGPTPAPGLERPLLPGRGLARPPPHQREKRSVVAPGPHLERGKKGALDHDRPKGAVASPLDLPILAQVQNRNKFKATRKTGKRNLNASE